MTILKTTSTVMICLAAALSSSAASVSAQNGNSRVPQPSPAAAHIDGCWSADRHLYGPYQLTFCPSGGGGGHYTVSGDGLHCSATLTWFQIGGYYQFAMRRAHCGRQTDWTADTFSCLLTPERGAGSGRVAVPSPGYGQLKCNYRPAVWTHPATKFSAYRS